MMSRFLSRRVVMMLVMLGVTWGPTGRCRADDMQAFTRKLIEALTSSPSKLREATDFPATHHQVDLITVDSEDARGHNLQSFCLSSEGNLLAAVSLEPGEIRVLDSERQLLDTWKLPVTPEAINVAPDGTVLVAGQGEWLKLDATGQVTLRGDDGFLG